MSNNHTARIVWRVLKTSFALLIFFVCFVLVLRMCTSGDPESMSRLSINQQLKDAYAQHGDDLLLQYQNQTSITLGANNRGYFSVTQYVFIPEAKQVQLVFRYNNSTIQHLKEDYQLSELPSKEAHLFDVTLVVTTDLTPDNREDNIEPSTLKSERYQPTQSQRDTTALYTYYRYTFDNVLVEDLTVGVFADIYYVGDLNYEEPAYGTLCLYDDMSDWMTKKLTQAEIEALREDKK